MEENNNFYLEMGDREITSLEELKELPTNVLLMLKKQLCTEKLKCNKAYKMGSVSIVLGSGLAVLGLATGAIVSSILGGLLIGRGIFNSSSAKIESNAYDQIVNAVEEEITYREVGKAAFPEFFPDEKKPNFDFSEFIDVWND